MTGIEESREYKKSGVNIDVSNEFVKNISKLMLPTHKFVQDRGAKVLLNHLSFASQIELPRDLKNPVLVSATDGVGTKLDLAFKYNRLNTIGQDLVAMCVNDILCAGAQPLYFLDYFATGKLDTSVAEEIVASIIHGCEIAGCALVGGETAELPQVFSESKFDIAGFAVGVEEKKNLLPKDIHAGDSLIAIASSGVHSNGYSLINRILSKNPEFADEAIDDVRIIDKLLQPTKIYCKSIKLLRENIPVHGLAHITGGGLVENLSRIIPRDLSLDIDWDKCSMPKLFIRIAKEGALSDSEMRKVFNCGIGMVVVVNSKYEDDVIKVLKNTQEVAWKIGSIF